MVRSRTLSLGIVSVVAVLLLCSTVAQAGRFELILERVQDYCRPREDDNRRAGYPRCIAPWAQCFPNRQYTGYYHGGGATLYGSRATWLRGEPRYMDEGTFGLDYDPWYSRVRLQWFHRNRN